MIAFLAMTAACSHATVIVLIKTKDGYWIGADSARGGNGDHIKKTVCKIHESNGWLLLKSGTSESVDRYGNVYSVDQVVKKLVDESKSIDQLKHGIEETFRSEVFEAIRWYIAQLSPATLQEDDPLANQPFQGPMERWFEERENRVIALIGYDKDQQQNIIFEGVPISTKDTHDPYFPYNFRVRTVGWVQTPYSNGPISFISYPVMPPIPDEKMIRDAEANPQMAIQKILEDAYQADPSHVGPPFTIIHVTAPQTELGQPDPFDGSKLKLKIKWIKKGVCPGWTTDLVPTKVSANSEVKTPR